MNRNWSRVLRVITIQTLCLLPFAAHAQIPVSQIVFAFAGVNAVSQTTTAPQVRLVENRIAGSLIEVARIDNYSIVEPTNREAILTQLRRPGRALSGIRVEIDSRIPARGLIYGEVNEISGRVYLDLFLFSISTGNLLRSESAMAGSFDELLEELPFLTYGLFDIAYERLNRPSGALDQSLPIAPEWRRAVTVGDVVGRWQGDEGLGGIVIEENGQAMATLPDGDSLRLRVTTNAGVVVVRQDEPNAPKIYMPFFPYSVSVQLVDRVRPMTWEFQLSNDGNRLVGTKETSYIFVERGSVTRVDNTYSRSATWTRSD